MYTPYVTPEEYGTLGSGSILPEKLQNALRQASRHVDALTYNRICEVVCQQADFETENEDEINMILSSYSINGVSAQFGSSWNIYTEHGVAMRRDVYALLCQTGLCCRLAI